MFKLTVAILPPCSKIRREGLLDDENWEVGEFGRGEEKHMVRNWLALVGQFSKCDMYLGCWVVGITGNQPRTMRIHTYTWERVSSVQSLSPVQSLSRVQLFATQDCSTPGLPVHHQLLESTQTRIHPVGDAIQLSHPLSSPSPLTFNLSQPQSLFQWVSSSLRWPKDWSFSLESVFPMNIQDWFLLGLTSLISLLSKRLSRVFFSTSLIL